MNLVDSWIAVALGFFAALVATPWLATWSMERGALRRVTARAPQDDERGLPRVGGIALAFGFTLAWVWSRSRGFALAPNLAEELSRWSHRRIELAEFAALACAFALGLADDLWPRGLRASTKLAGQLAVALVLVAPSLARARADGTLALWLAALAVFVVFAQNAVNTFDNADGAAGSLCLLALLWTAPTLAAPIGGFLVWNLPSSRPSRAILGDAGSHFAALLVVLTPAAWPALALPALDLARVVVGRIRDGRKPWVGDRTHWAHRLHDDGFPGPRVLAELLAIAAPSIVLGGFGVVSGSIATAVRGVVATGALFAFALLQSERRARAARRVAAAPNSQPRTRERSCSETSVHG